MINHVFISFSAVQICDLSYIHFHIILSWTEQSPKIGLVKNFSFLWPLRNMAIGALSRKFWILIAGFKQLPGLKKAKMLMSSITLKFKTISKATADNMTGKVVGKNSSFRLWSCSETHLWRFWTMFCFKEVCFFASSSKKVNLIYCYWTSFHVSFIWLPLFGYFRFYSVFTATQKIIFTVLV